MNAPATISASVPALVMDETELMKVLQNSLYPGAKPESIKLVLGYCKAAGLDPMQKPVHIVPISVKQGQDYVMRDVVMPGIGLYRTQASRSGEYAGITEPEFGPIKQLKAGEFTLDYPEWCRVTVRRRMESGQIVEFTANERWLENYATAKRDTNMPNAMWKRRPFAQLAKCAEAQALRKAFPEIGAAPTADEMEGKPIDEGTVIEHEPQKLAGPPPYADADFAADLPKFTKLIKSGKKTPEQVIAMVSTKVVPSAEQKAAIMALAPKPEPGVTFAVVASRLQAATDPDILAAEADLIRSIADATQRSELDTIYRKRQAELEVTQ